jgi:thiol-disulfide isomerase/thioredoxin
MRKNKVVQWAILLVILLVGGYVIGSSFISKDASKVEVGQYSPAFKLANLQGEVYSLSKWKGKPIVLNFWGSFCEPCVREMPLISMISEEYKDKGLVVVGINLDEPKVVVNSFVRNNPVKYTILLDPRGIVRDRYEVTSYPTTFFIDRDGKIKDIYVGELDQKTLRLKIEQVLR